MGSLSYVLRAVSGVTGRKQRRYVLQRLLHRMLGRLTTHPLAVGVDEGHVGEPYQCQYPAKVGFLEVARSLRAFGCVHAAAGKNGNHLLVGWNQTLS